MCKFVGPLKGVRVLRRWIATGAILMGVTPVVLTYSPREYPNWMLVHSDSGFADGEGGQKESSER
jgi:hypothetical protein